MVRFALLVLVLALASFGPTPAHAWHKRTPAVVQITPVNAGPIAHPRWAGYRYVFFDSEADILGNGSQGGQVYYFDLQERDKTGNLAVHQLVSGGSPQRASTGIRGKVVAFDAHIDNPYVRNIYVIDRTIGVPVALTRGWADSLNPIMDDGSRVVVFESSSDFFEEGLAGSQIYRIDLKLANSLCPYPCPESGNLGLTQLTHTNGHSRNAVTSKGGKVVVFESDADLLNTGETQTQIYRVDALSGTISALSHGPGASRNPSLSRTGGFSAFESEADLTGAGTGGTQVFVHRQSTGALQQLTFAPGGHSTRPSLETNGKGVIFISTDDLTSTGSTGPEVFAYDLAHNTLGQITNVAGITSDPAHSAGVFTAFVTDADLLGSGSTGLGLYLVNLFALGDDTVP